MQNLLSIVQFVAANYQALIAAAVGILSGVIAICLLIPGDQPEKSLQKVVDILQSISRK